MEDKEDAVLESIIITQTEIEMEDQQKEQEQDEVNDLALQLSNMTMHE